MADHRHHGEGEHHHGNVAMPAMPGSALVVVEPELVLGGLKTVLDCPPMAFDLHQCFDRCCRWAPGGEEGEIATSIEETLALWAASLREIKKRIRPLFGQERVAKNAGLFLEGLLGDEQRKTGWMRAEAAGDPGPWRQQAILGRRDWDADALRDIVRDYVIEHLADDDAVLVIDETGFLKQGKASCGVARQYTGSAGKITNCQIGVFAAYVSCHGHAFIDRALYLPKEWTDDPARLEAAYVPADTGFATKPKLPASTMFESWLPMESENLTQGNCNVRRLAMGSNSLTLADVRTD